MPASPPLAMITASVLLLSSTPALGQHPTPVEATATPTTPTAHRLAGTDRYGTAIAITKELYQDHQADVILLASGEDFPDALTATNLAVAKQAPLLLSPTSDLTSEIEAEIIRLAKPSAKVMVIGGKLAINDTVDQRLTALGYTVERLSGVNRVDTAIKIANQVVLTRPSGIVISPSDDYATTMVAAVYAARTNKVHLITPTVPRSPLPQDVKEWTNYHSNLPIEVIGNEIGTDVASRSSRFIRSDILLPTVREQCDREVCLDYTIDRLYDPADHAISEYLAFAPPARPEQVVLVNAESPVDGIAAGQLAALRKAPVLPIRKSLMHRHAVRWASTKPASYQVMIVGGEVVMPKDLIDGFIKTVTQAAQQIPQKPTEA